MIYEEGVIKKASEKPTSFLKQQKRQFCIQQGLEIRGFWFQKKTVQLKTALHEVYTYVLKGIFFSKNSLTSRLQCI